MASAAPYMQQTGAECICATTLQVQAQVERLSGLITAARAPTHGAAAPNKAPSKQAAASPAAASDGPGSKAGTKRANADGLQRQPRKQQKQKHTTQSAVAA